MKMTHRYQRLLTILNLHPSVILTKDALQLLTRIEQFVIQHMTDETSRQLKKSHKRMCQPQTIYKSIDEMFASNPILKEMAQGEASRRVNRFLLLKEEVSSTSEVSSLSSSEHDQDSETDHRHRHRHKHSHKRRSSSHSSSNSEDEEEHRARRKAEKKRELKISIKRATAARKQLRQTTVADRLGMVFRPALFKQALETECPKSTMSAAVALTAVIEYILGEILEITYRFSKHSELRDKDISRAIAADPDLSRLFPREILRLKA